jgi:hypothetical protein
MTPILAWSASPFWWLIFTPFNGVVDNATERSNLTTTVLVTTLPLFAPQKQPYTFRVALYYIAPLYPIK